MTPFICAGCKEPIMERHLMKVLDKSWHQRCVKCSDCNCELNERCYSRESKLYCRGDFFRRFGTRCSRCNIGFCPEDLVRRAVNKVFHVQCFYCTLCRKQLSTGEQLYLVQGEKFVCVQCYQMSTQSITATASSMAAPNPKPDTVKFASPTTLSQQVESPLHTPSPTIAAISSSQVLSTPPSQLQQQQLPISDSRKGKTRTSITPQQLVVLLEVYNREQRPSKQTREELMAKTGLDMKVIQVWFQNRRSKEKRDASYREAMKEESPLTHVTLPSMPPPISSMVPAMATSATPVTTSSDNTVPTSLPGGHTFHFTCLSQWLAHQKTCPQCRERCLPRNVIKLFIDTGEQHSRNSDNTTLDPREVAEKLDLQESLLKHKDQALSEAKASLEEIREEMQAWQAQHEATHKRLKTEQAANSSLKKQLGVLQFECDQAQLVKREADQLRQKVSTMEGLQRVLRDTKEEVETLVKNYTSPTKLATFVIAMKRDYEALKERKDKLTQDVNSLKKHLRSREAELKSSRSQLSVVEKDLHAAEQEKENLIKKVEILERAVESPGSRVALLRVLESPMPDLFNKPQQELGASPLLAAHSHNPLKEKHSVPYCVQEKHQPIGSKRNSSEINTEETNILMPVNKLSKKNSSKNFAAGFNGMGGQAKFAIPKSKLHKPSAPNKGLKFAPRSIAPPKKKPAQTLPALQLKF